MNENLLNLNWHEKNRAGGIDYRADLWLINGKSSYMAVNARLVKRLQLNVAKVDTKSVLAVAFALEKSTGQHPLVLTMFNAPRDFKPKMFVASIPGHSFIHFSKGLVSDVVDHLNLDRSIQRHNFKIVKAEDYSLTRELYLIRTLMDDD